jgi:Zn-dependent protease
MNLNTAMQLIAIAAIPLIFAITLHEAAHGWVASKFGDNTALMLGRVTLNPVKHIDPIGTVLFPIITMLLSGFIFGWAKPVPVNFNNLKNPRRDAIFVALAGPISNFIMAILWAIIAKLMLMVFVSDAHPILKTTATFIHLSAQFGILINCLLMVLNLIPIPPLDGSRVVSSLIPPRAAYYYEKIEPYGIWILLALLIFGVLGYVLWPPIHTLTSLISSTFGIPTLQSLRR